jgi:hypothetical protein
MAGYESAGDMEEVIARWLGLVPSDQGIKEGCEGYDVSVEFEVEDLDFFFHIHFQDGDLSGGIGEFPGEAMVELCMSSEVFDGMFSPPGGSEPAVPGRARGILARVVWTLAAGLGCGERKLPLPGGGWRWSPGGSHPWRHARIPRRKRAGQPGVRSPADVGDLRALDEGGPRGAAAR